MSSIKASIIIIGDEILSGKTQDVNLNFLAKRLGALGIELVEVSIIPDIESEIIRKVQEFSHKHDYVFCTGGIGPTHDDITSESVAKAFNTPLELNDEALKLLESYYFPKNQTLNEARKKMAYIPLGAQLINNPVSLAPGFRIENVFIMAGVPNIMQAMFEEIMPELKKNSPIETLSLNIKVGESLIADSFANLQKKFPDVKMGSYPYTSEGNHYTSLVLRSNDNAKLTKAFSELETIMSSFIEKKL